ncbi:hypothetical protein M3B46_19410 [Sphingobacterium daejeonense]|uniref:hypothetical protein n=1 Tax=Sphingobacterium daejeonense TaxID=371142 RepID=UPI0021A272D9|nr:hypothetical protein [Sphingobacterium daejeonense]MCT1533175.1 hypothetical protein [Sphingobacterium daejeonense]
MKPNIILLLILTTFSICLYAQDIQLKNNREISVYNVVAQTSKGKVKGILQKVTQDQVEIMTSKDLSVIPVENIKSLKVKFDKRENIPVLNNIAQTGLDFVFDPEYDQSYIKNESGFYEKRIDAEEITLGEKAIVGGAVIAGALVGNEIKKLMPTATIEKFKINFSKAKYSEIYEELLMYTVDLQVSPGYEQILKVKLRDAMGRNKLKI